MNKIVTLLQDHWKFILAGFCLGVILMIPFIWLFAALVDNHSVVWPSGLAAKMLVAGGLGMIIFPAVWLHLEKGKRK